MKRLLLLSCMVVCAAAHAQASKVTGDAARGAGKVAMCIGCHGISGYQASFPEVHKVPMIAGQSATYLMSALTAYKNGDRKHPTMRAIAGSLSEQDIADLAAHYSRLGRQDGAPPGKTPNQRMLALITRDKSSDCTKCHGANFSTPNDGTVAKLAGQHADYLAAALRAYKTDNHPMIGRSNPVMGAQARKFSNDEIRELASYISALPGDLQTVTAPRLRETK